MKKTYNPAPQVASFQDTTVKEWLATQIKVNSFFTTINSNTSTVLTYDNKGRSKDYYTVKLRVKPTMLDQKFLKLFEVQGGINTQITDIFATFKIDKKTGYFRTIEIDGSFTAELAGIGMKCSVYYKQNYLTMNSAATAAMQPIVKANFGIDMKI